VLDYSGNVRRHGPVDDIHVGKKNAKGEADEKGEAGEKVKEETMRAKECPSCGSLVHIRTMECKDCGHIWEAPAKHEAKADNTARVMVKEIEEEWHNVTSISAAAHTSQSSGKTTLRVDYYVGVKSYSEWICLDHDQWALENARQWWRLMTGETLYPDVARAAKQIQDGETHVNCVAIRIKKQDKFWRISHRLRSDSSIVDEKNKVQFARKEAA
jgi:DNA repair protein RadD